MCNAETLIDTKQAHAAEAIRQGVLVLAGGSFPSRAQPVHGVFVKERARHVAQLPNIDMRVLAPSPFFPPLKQFKRWYPWSQIPRHEIVDGLEVLRPRYFLPPKFGGYFHPRLMLPAATRAIRRLQREFHFSLIDSHFIYPNGVLAAKLGQRLGKPVIMTGRGEDILRFPELPLIGPQIRKALRQATQLIALSDDTTKSCRFLNSTTISRTQV